MAFIQVDYQNAIAQAKKLENAAKICGDAAKEIKSQSGDSEQYWKGLSGNAMRSKMTESVNELTSIHNTLLFAAADIRKVAEELQEADQNIANTIRMGG